jgi:hypothetical protein
MTDLFAQPRAALARRYFLKREFGTGGMPTVYFAEDLKLHRPVVVRVLRSECAPPLRHPQFPRTP